MQRDNTYKNKNNRQSSKYPVELSAQSDSHVTHKHILAQVT